MWWYNSLDVFGYKIDIFHISCAIALFSFITLVLKLWVHGYLVVVFIPEFLVSVTFACITTLESETTSTIIATSPSSLLWKCEYELFEYYALLLFFFRSYLAKIGVKITLPKNKLMQLFSRHWSMGQPENSRFTATNRKDRFKL